MKRALIFLALLGLSFVGCQPGLEENESPSTPQIQLSQQVIKVDYESNEYSITVTSPYSWDATSKNDWIILKTHGAVSGTKELKFIVEHNDDVEMREGVIVIRNEHMDMYADLIVKQESSSPFITIGTSEVTIGHEGSQVNIELTTNLEKYDIEIPTEAQSWIHLDNTRAKHSDELTFTISENETQAERKAIVVISNSEYNLSQNITFTQKRRYEFILQVENIGETTATVKITPNQEGRTYYWGINAEADVKEFATTVAFMEDWYAYMKEAVDTGYYTWEELLDKGVVEYTTEKVKPSTKYVLWAFGIDLNGNLTSPDLTYVTFETKASTFNTASWYGYWNVTAPKCVSVDADPLSGDPVTKFVKKETSKVIAIVDASADLGNGYVYVYGWDGVFEMELPAVGVIFSNKIKLANEFVIFTEEDETFGPLDYTWNGISYLEGYGDWYPIGGSYDCYTITNTGEGTASVTAYQGQLTDGTAFMTDYYSVQAVITTGQYKGYSLSFNRSDGQPAIYLSGATMTAEFLAPLEEVAAQKLNANKKFKVAHKMATPRAAAKFSSVANLVK